MDPKTASALIAQYQKVKDDPTRFTAYAENPVGFVREVIGAEPWAKQAEFMEAVRDDPKVAMRSGHGIGKSAGLAWLILWWFYAKQGRVISTAPTREHLEDVLWAEVAKWKRDARVHLPIDVLKLDMKVDADWYATGLSTDTPSAFQGRHHPRLLMLADEAAGVPEQVFVEMMACATDPANRVVLVGNPTQTSGTFYEAFKFPDLWRGIRVSCLDHPNVVQGQTVIPGAVSAQWVEERRRMWGETHPFWYCRVLGEFPKVSNRGVIPLGHVEAAQHDEKREAALTNAAAARLPKIAGLDVARYGDNRCVWLVRHGDAIVRMESWGHTSLMETTGKVLQLAREDGVADVVVDASGVGGGVVDRLNEQTLDFRLHAFNSGHRAGRSGLYINRRAELWWHVRQRLEKGRLWLPVARETDDAAKLVADLLAPEYEVNSAGRIKVESKEDMLERGVKSPDYADALVMCFATEPDPEDDLVPSRPVDQDPVVYAELTQTDDPTFGQLPHGF